MKKTNIEWLMELPDGYRALALENADEERLTYSDVSLAEALKGSFYWYKTRQGHSFWNDVCNHYRHGTSLPPLPPPTPRLPNTTFTAQQFRVIDIAKKWGLFLPENASPIKQAHKLIEEAAELIEGEAVSDTEAQMDAVGDCLVVLINYCHMKGFDPITCLTKAADVIEKRTGKIINGKFIKDQE